jgi:hypothetical protein
MSNSKTHDNQPMNNGDKQGAAGHQQAAGQHNNPGSTQQGGHADSRNPQQGGAGGGGQARQGTPDRDNNRAGNAPGQSKDSGQSKDKSKQG